MSGCEAGPEGFQTHWRNGMTLPVIIIVLMFNKLGNFNKNHVFGNLLYWGG